MSDSATLLELFILDASVVLSGSFFFITNETEPVVFDGETYQSHPIQSEGYDKSSDGNLPEPTITIGDADGFYGRLVRALDNLSGCRVIRRRIRADELDNPAMEYPQDIYYVNQINIRSGLSVTLTLRSPLDVGRRKFPARKLSSVFSSNATQ